jgi:ATP-binding cassette subfamily B protein
VWDVVRTLVRPGVEDEGLVEVAPAVGVREVYRRFWPYARPLRWWLLVGVLFGSAGPLLGGLGIWLSKILVDEVLVPRDFAAFPWLAGAYVGITVATGVIGFVGIYVAAWTGEDFLHRLRTSVFAHLQTLSVSFFDRRRLGDIISRLTGDIVAIEGIVLSGVAGLFVSVVKVFVFGGVLFFLNWQLALISLVVVPLFWLLSRSFARRIKQASGEVRRRSGSIASVVEESLGNAPLVQAYGREQAEIRRFAGQSRASVAATLRAERIGGLFSPLIDLVQVLGVISIVGIGAWQLSAGRITLGELLAFLLSLSMLYGPISGLGHMSTGLFAAAAGGERILELLDQQPEVRRPEHPAPLGRAAGRILVEDMGFRYPDTTADVLRGISFSAQPGQTTALVGVSGAGKSTIARLLLRLYDPTSGRITLDGHDLRDLDPAELRANIAIVLQETLLLDDTVAENIRAGRPDATDDQVVAAAKAADAHEFIEELPEGYATRVGQRGRLLSGGQRQRVAIARAMVRDAPVLLLDEPTAGLDARASDRILAPVRRLMAGRTTIVISHDLLTVAEADQILYLDRGRIAEAGTHEQLLRAGNGYAYLYRLRHPESRRVAPCPGPRAAGDGRRGAPGPDPEPVAPTAVPEHDGASGSTSAGRPASSAPLGAERPAPVPGRPPAPPRAGTQPHLRRGSPTDVPAPPVPSGVES